MTAAHIEAVEIEELENTELAPDSVVYLISTSWWNTWRAYSNYRGQSALKSQQRPLPAFAQGVRPGPISNKDLLPRSDTTPSAMADADADDDADDDPHTDDAKDTPLRRGLEEQVDFVTVTERSWKSLHAWYGGGPAIARRVVLQRPAPGTAAAPPPQHLLRVALYPFTLEVHYRPIKGPERQCTLEMDGSESLAHLKARTCRLLEVPNPQEVELYDYTGRKPVASLEVVKVSAQVRRQANAADGVTAMAAEPAAPAADANNGVHGGAGAGAAVGAATAAALQRTLVEAAVVDKQLLLLRNKDEGAASDSDDACGSDPDAALNNRHNKSNDINAAAPPAARAGPAAAARARAVEASRKAAAGAGAGDSVIVLDWRQDTGGLDTSGGGGGGSGAGPVRKQLGDAPPAVRVPGPVDGFFGGGRSGGVTRTMYGEDISLPREGQAAGLAGLSNLGNTCFMNSSLQCLSHTLPLMRSFLGATYLLDLNRSNPLGMKGELAEAFGALMTRLWKGNVSAVTPRSFKAKLACFAPQFSGYAQHDSQEFLAFLLDGLHEDTNRIKVKPYIEEKDAAGRPDAEVAVEAWANYRKRNDSLVVDHFQGLYKSTVDCPQCGYNSVKFDPFMYLSLPLPKPRVRMVEVVLVHMDGGAAPLRMALEVGCNATVRELMVDAARVAGLPEAVVSEPDAHLLLAKPTRETSLAKELDPGICSNLDARLQILVDAAGSCTTSSFALNKRNTVPHLVMYYWPWYNYGPKGEGMRRVVVHLRRRSPKNSYSDDNTVACGVPLVLFVPDEGPVVPPDALTQQESPAFYRNRTVEYWVEAAGTHLLHALDDALRPFLRPGFKPPSQTAAGRGQQAEAEEGGAEDAGGPSPMAVETAEGAAGCDGAAGAAGAQARTSGSGRGDGGGLEQLPGALADALHDADGAAVAVGAGAHDADGAASALSAPPTPDLYGGGAGAPPPAAAAAPAAEGAQALGGDAAAAAPAGDGDVDMDGCENLEPLVNTEDGAGGAASSGQQQQAARVLQPYIFGAHLAPPPPPPPPPAAAGVAGAQPFNMWSVQEAVQPSIQAAAGGGGGAPYQLKLCTLKGRPYAYTNKPDPDGIDRDDPKYFVAVFQEPCAAFDVDALDAPPQAHPSAAEVTARHAAGPPPCTLAQCMESFLQPERLSESDAWYCPRCKAHVCADKKLDLWSLPEVLVVHLKRFSYTRHSRDKMDMRVDFPMHGLDLSPYLLHQQDVPPLYDLYAVSNHYGSLGGGHYTAYAKVLGDGQDSWYCFDDSHVSSLEPSCVCSPAAYVLFYRRRAEASQDPLRISQLLSQLEEQRKASLAKVQAQAGAGSPCGSERGADQQPDHDQGPQGAGPASPLLRLGPGPAHTLTPPQAAQTFGPGGGHDVSGGDLLMGAYGPAAPARPSSPALGADGISPGGAGQGDGDGDGDLMVVGRSMATIAGGLLMAGGAAGSGRNSPELPGALLNHDDGAGPAGRMSCGSGAAGRGDGDDDIIDAYEAPRGMMLMGMGAPEGSPSGHGPAQQHDNYIGANDWASDRAGSMSGDATHDISMPTDDEDDDAAGGSGLQLMATSPN